MNLSFMKDVNFKETSMKIMANISLTFLYDTAKFCKHGKE